MISCTCFCEHFQVCNLPKMDFQEAEKYCNFYKKNRPVAEWKDNKCTNCGEKAFTDVDAYGTADGYVLTPYCSWCGASMVSSNSKTENPCKTCTKYIENMCEQVCEKRYEYVMKGGEQK